MEDYKNKIIIKKSFVEENNGLYRMNTPIIENGKEYNVYVEVEKQYSDYLTPERADAQVYLALPIAVREGYDIYSEMPVTEMFLHNLNEVLIPHLALGDSRIHKIEIHAATDNSPIGGEGIGTGISCGVDSLFTLKEYTSGKYPNMQLTHLFIGSINMELMDTRHADLYTWVNEHKPQFERYEQVSKETGLPLIKVYTNYFFFLSGKEYNRDWKYYHHLFTHHYITMATVLALKKLWRLYYFSSSYDFTSFSLKNNLTNDPSHYELLCMHSLCVPDFTCFSGGAAYDRFAKTVSLMDYKIAQMTLHPCHSKGEKNCTKPDCDKCLRALTVLDAYDKLDDFKHVFDIDVYRKNHSEFMYNLVKLYNTPYTQPFYTESYKLLQKKYPREMRGAEAAYEWDSSPTVQKWQYNIVDRSYETVLALLNFDDPALIIKGFFERRSISKLYITGAPRFSKTVKRLLLKFTDEIQVYDYKTKRVQDCDGIFIADAAKSIIDKKIKQFVDAGIARDKIYSFFDLQDYLNDLIRDE